ncbi:KUP/HAK/KT family potassium transporter Ecym_3158 [Eremothecium cymbalariae DBVPG|uniref:Potassium transporter n=1 Tax=Eremothecium cymbalariae (strain CBS 270.75 / DBVPG 7215 / KCTC 17166 / NRRL Y-17582) TaxID=931890 RepID=G8JR92_ERECY|nr:Hypothetical protein Ecym_3158 [Eremothecium cymbalariae DBVPG\
MEDFEAQSDKVFATSAVEEAPNEYIEKKDRKWLTTLTLAFSSLGSIYGDLGTSPLYVLTTLFDSGVEVSEANVFGALSCIFWVFTLIVICKYCLIVLTLGPNNGEGGQIAIYSKISQVLNTGPKGVSLAGNAPEKDSVILERSRTADNPTSTTSSLFRKKFSLLERANIRKGFSFSTMAMCLLGCSLVISDGLLTPTTSVLSAIDGIAVSVPSFKDKVLPISVCVLIGLFTLQPLGTNVVSALFSPVIFLWFITIFVIGVFNIVSYPMIFKTLNPVYAIRFLRHHGIYVLASVMLSITGCEAMFADVGHFSPLSVQLTLAFFVYPCLITTYLGQGAYLLKHPEAASNVFYMSIPGNADTWFYWFVFVIAALATVFASQTLILGVFSIIQQMVHLDCCPKLRIIHKSAKHHGRVYLPAVNIILMIAVICTCIGFKSSNNVTSAYGLGVSMDLFLTSTFMAICMIVVYNVHWAIVLAYYLGFGTFEIILVIGNLRKVADGAWFTLMMTAITTGIFALWRWGRNLMIREEQEGRPRLNQLIVNEQSRSQEVVQLGDEIPSINIALSHVDLIIEKQHQVKRLTKYPALALLFTELTPLLESAGSVPKLFSEIANSFPNIPEFFVFVAIKIVSVPYLEVDQRVLVEPMKNVNGFYRCVFQFGFMNKVAVAEEDVRHLLSIIALSNPNQYHSVSKSLGAQELPVIRIFGSNVIRGKRTQEWEGKSMFSSPKAITKFFLKPLEVGLSIISFTHFISYKIIQSCAAGQNTLVM